MKTASELHEWAEDHGYVSYRCPNCRRRFATDSAVECPYCGEQENEEEESNG